MVYFVDTNIFLRVLVVEDQKTFRECRDFLTAVKQNKIDAVTSNLVLAELVWVLVSYYKIKRIEVARMVRGILGLSGLKLMDRYEPNQAIQYYEVKKVKYIDAILASVPELENGDWTIVSYDKDFEKLEIKRSEPGKVLSGE